MHFSSKSSKWRLRSRDSSKRSVKRKSQKRWRKSLLSNKLKNRHWSISCSSSEMNKRVNDSKRLFSFKRSSRTLSVRWTNDTRMRFQISTTRSERQWQIGQDTRLMVIQKMGSRPPWWHLRCAAPSLVWLWCLHAVAEDEQPIRKETKRLAKQR